MSYEEFKKYRQKKPRLKELSEKNARGEYLTEEESKEFSKLSEEYNNKRSEFESKLDENTWRSYILRLADEEVKNGEREPFKDRFPIKKSWLKKIKEEGGFEYGIKRTEKDNRILIERFLQFLPKMKKFDKRRIGRFIGPLYLGFVFKVGPTGPSSSIYIKNMVAIISPHEAEDTTRPIFTVDKARNPSLFWYESPDEVIEESIKVQSEEFIVDPNIDSLTLQDIAELFPDAFFNPKSIKAVISAWAGEEELAKKYYDQMVAFHDPHIKGGLRKNWEIEKKRAKEWIDNPGLIREKFIERVKEFGMEKIPYEDIIDAPYKEEFFKNRK